jgi:hypothetical protein
MTETPPSPGESADVRALVSMEMIDAFRGGSGALLAVELEKLRAQLPYGNEIELTVRWRP